MATRDRWSLTDAQLTNLRETNLRESWGEHKRRQKLNPAARSAQAPRKPKPKPVSRPSPARIAERSGTYSDGTSRRQTYNEMTYGKPDVASLGDPVSPYRKHGDVGPVSHKAQDFMLSGQSRGGQGNFGNPNIPKRDMAVGGPRPDSASAEHRRQASTQAAYRAADASMFNSNVTPKAERVKDKRPRSRMSPDQNVFW